MRLVNHKQIGIHVRKLIPGKIVMRRQRDCVCPQALRAHPDFRVIFFAFPENCAYPIKIIFPLGHHDLVGRQNEHLPAEPGDT